MILAGRASLWGRLYAEGMRQAADGARKTNTPRRMPGERRNPAFRHTATGRTGSSREKNVPVPGYAREAYARRPRTIVACASSRAVSKNAEERSW